MCTHAWTWDRVREGVRGARAGGRAGGRARWRERSQVHRHARWDSARPAAFVSLAALPPPPYLVLHVHVGAGPEQRLDHHQVALVSGQHQRRKKLLSERG